MNGMLLAVLLVALAGAPAAAQMAGPTVTSATPAASAPGPAPMTGTVGPTPTVLPSTPATKVPGFPSAHQVRTTKPPATKAPATIAARTAPGQKGHAVHAKGGAKKPVVTHVAHGKVKTTKKSATTPVAHRKGPRPSASPASDDLLRPRV